jgi:hypothetical protein
VQARVRERPACLHGAGDTGAELAVGAQRDKRRRRIIAVALL